jgi:phosphatidylglycerophosphate synthase
MTWKDRIDRALSPLTRFFAALGVTPNMLTLFGTALAAGTPWLLLKGHPIAAGVWLLLAGAFDTLDGALARNQGLKGPFGAFLDSSMDGFPRPSSLPVSFFIFTGSSNQPMSFGRSRRAC